MRTTARGSLWLLSLLPVVGCGRSDVFPQGAGTGGSIGTALPGVGGALVAAPRCGDGHLDPGERCDDGNNQDGDGCSSSCVVEPCYPSCDGTRVCGASAHPCILHAVCGNGVRDGDETCDDGNTQGADGCAPDCTVERGWRCRVPDRACTPICGDGIVIGSEQCDDGNRVSGDGCTAACLEEPTDLGCGDGIRSGAEECDDGPANGTDGWPCHADCTFGPICGDGEVSGDEPCDRGAANGELAYGPDGCTSSCQRTPYCGDTIVQTQYGEQCDNGTYYNGQVGNCTANCKFVVH